MAFSLEHLGLAASDTVALKDWYLRVFEGKLLFSSADNPPTFFVELCGGLTVEIYPAKAHFSETGNNSVAGWRHLALRVDSIESARDALIGRGVAFPDPIKPAGGGGRVLFFADPAGNLLHLVERPQGSIFRR